MIRCTRDQELESQLNLFKRVDNSSNSSMKKSSQEKYVSYICGITDLRPSETGQLFFEANLKFAASLNSLNMRLV